MTTAQAKDSLLIDCANALEIKDAEIAELIEALRKIKDALVLMHKDAKATNRSFALLPDEKQAIEMANELLKKYEK